MPRRLIKRYLPDPHKIRENKYLRLFGARLQDPNLWHLNRRSVAGAMGIGVFVAFIPIPFQMVVSAAAAMLFRVNLPLAVAMVWISNPFTMAPMLFISYKTGMWTLGREPRRINFRPSLEWLLNQSSELWIPLLLGSVVLGAVAGALTYIAMRLIWRLHIIHLIRNKRRRKSSQTGRCH